MRQDLPSGEIFNITVNEPIRFEEAFRAYVRALRKAVDPETAPTPPPKKNVGIGRPSMTSGAMGAGLKKGALSGSGRLGTQVIDPSFHVQTRQAGFR